MFVVVGFFNIGSYTKHREHTIMLSRERVNKATKRMNSLPFSPVVISLIAHAILGKLLLTNPV